MCQLNVFGVVCVEIVMLVVFVLPPFCEQSPYMPNYDIWGDAVKSANKADLVQAADVTNDYEVDENHFRNTSRRNGKILQFFGMPEERECSAKDGRRSGLCLNTYRCHMLGGDSSGPCAHGFGVCCVFVVTCGKEIKKNITYFVSPEFPSLSRNIDSCALTVRKMEGASQLRLDFIHFNLGQPNRLTGECDSDIFVMSRGNSKDFKLCGQNSGQHIYYDIDKAVDVVMIDVRMSRPTLQRMWEIRVTQIPFNQRAPADCLQYHTTRKGVIQTMNFAENGRHLSDQDYRACVRQARGMCSIAYEPCDDSSFRIGPSAALSPQSGMAFGSMGGPGSMGVPGSMGGAGSEFVNAAQDPMQTNPMQSDPMGEGTDIEGSGDGTMPALSTNMVGRRFTRWSPYAQHLGVQSGVEAGGNTGAQGRPGDGVELWRYWGYGNYGQGVSSFGRQRCRDRLITPCDGDEFIGTSIYSPGVCDPYHCGPSFCEGSESRCRMETSAKPFAVGVRFGPPVIKMSPEDNIGACLRFEQVPCST